MAPARQSEAANANRTAEFQYASIYSVDAIVPATAPIFCRHFPLSRSTSAFFHRQRGGAIYFASLCSMHHCIRSGMAKPKSKSAANDNTIAYAIGTTLFCLVLGFVLFLPRLNASHKIAPTVAYASFGPMVIHVSGYAFSATMAVQTGAADAKWAAQNKKALGQILQATLTKADPRNLRGRNGLLSLQDELTVAANAAFNTEKVQSVLFTDFLLETDDN